MVSPSLHWNYDDHTEVCKGVVFFSKGYHPLDPVYVKMEHLPGWGIIYLQILK